MVKIWLVGHFYSQQAHSKKILGSNCSGTAISAFFGPILINFNHWILWKCYFVKMLFSRYNLRGIGVSLEVSLLSSFYLFRFCFILHLSFIILTLRWVMRWDLWVMTQIISPILRILSFFLLPDILESLSTELIGDFIDSVWNIWCLTAIFTP